MELAKSQSRLECYLVLKRDDEVAKYLFVVRDRKQRQTLTEDRLSDRNWTFRKEDTKKQTETHFLPHCKTFNEIRNIYIN